MGLNIYLHYDGNCREAFDFYRSVFGGEYESITTFREGPPGLGVAEEELDGVMHVSLPLGTGFLMGSDMPAAFGGPPVQGNNFSVSVEPSDLDEMEEQFAKLSEGGTVTTPLEKMFWGAYFAACIDKFGVNWQFNLSFE